ncbi:small acid-soluble spore protein Tlp [Salipaludibacillus agaradhaerens]|uniref:small acid-soluble spore protein Tlp n=1 Tax=Salipaludibacillus agaradhaerens TaxID=76935 RepID=UPI000998D413
MLYRKEAWEMAKKDDRSNNVERLEAMVENTEENIEEASSTLDNRHLSEQEKNNIRHKNERREQSIEAFKNEIADEKGDREHGRI